jgi:hypothetical protein
MEMPNGNGTEIAAGLGFNFPGSSWYADTYLLMKGEDLPLEKRSQSTETDFKRVRPP